MMQRKVVVDTEYTSSIKELIQKVFDFNFNPVSFVSGGAQLSNLLKVKNHLSFSPKHIGKHHEYILP